MSLCVAMLHGIYFQKEIFFVAGITRQAYNKHWKSEDVKEGRDRVILALVQQARGHWGYKKMGSRPLHTALGINQIGINQFEKLLSENSLTVPFKRRRIITTEGLRDNSDVNRIKGLEIRDINKVISGDITYFYAEDELYYIFTLKDAYSKMIVGLYGSKTMRATSAVMCLKQVIRMRKYNALKDCIHHSDAGSQYKSALYRSCGSFFKWSIADNCLENGMAEQLNFILKDHYLENEKIGNVMQLNSFLSKVKKFMNEVRPVKELRYKTPLQFEKDLKNIPIKKRISFRFSSFR